MVQIIRGVKGGKAVFDLNLELPRVTKTVTEGNYGRYTIGPVLAGFSTALANALRRVLLSSLPGVAISSLSIEGVQHEFQDIPNVKEDVVDLVLNLKKVRLRSFADRPVEISLNVQGEGVITAGALTTPGTVEVVNPDQYLATLDNEQAHLNMQLVVETGRGFVPLEVQAAQRTEPPPIGVILIDALYSPVTSVNFTIEEMCRERPENTDQIILEITTDGTISPEEALYQAANILRKQFFVVASHEYGREEQNKPAHSSNVVILRSIYNQGIEDLGLSFRAYNALRRSGITKVGHLLVMDEHELLLIRNFGTKGFQELVERLRIKGCFPPKDE